MKEINTIPNKLFSMKSFPSLNFKSFELIINPIDIKINAQIQQYKKIKKNSIFEILNHI